MKLYYWQDEKQPSPNWIVTPDGAACVKACDDSSAGKVPQMTLYATPADGKSAEEAKAASAVGT